MEKRRLWAKKRHKAAAERQREAAEGTTYAPGLLVEDDN